MHSTLFALVADESGQGVAEYAMIIGGISLSVIVALSALGVNLSSVYTDITHDLNRIPAKAPK